MDIKKYSEIFSALSNPHRLEIFVNLASSATPEHSCTEHEDGEEFCKCTGLEGSCCASLSATKSCVGDIGKILKLAPSTISHHLKELKRAGLINMERQGKNVECWVEPEILTILSSFFDEPIKV